MSTLSAQELVEQCLAASTADGQVAYVTEHSEANLRWAANSLTTNGAMRSRMPSASTTLCVAAAAVGLAQSPAPHSWKPFGVHRDLPSNT